MNVFNAITIGNWEIPGWTLETALFWLVAALVVITVLMIIVFAVLLHRVGREPEVKEKQPKTVDYVITVDAPEGLPILQAALFSGDTQIGLAVNVFEGIATISAVPGDYTVKLFGIPQGYSAEPAIVSTENLSALITVSKEPDKASKDLPVMVYNGIIASNPVEEETVDYIIDVVAPEELTELQVALFNGSEQVGSAVNVIDGKATIAAVPGDYKIRVFGLPDDDYEAESELVSATKLTATVNIYYCEDYSGYIEEESEEEETEEEKPELSVYNVYVEAPEELNQLQVALFNGDTQVGPAVNVIDGKAEISEVAGEYSVKLFGLPAEGYQVESELLSATKLEAKVTVTAIKEEVVEEYVPEPVAVEEIKPEIIEYNVKVEGFEGLPALQIALFNGDEQIGSAVNVENGEAQISAEAGDYVIKLFGLPDGYDYKPECLSATNNFATVVITELAKEEIAATEAPAVEPVIYEEESFEGGILRYDRSFKARFIQSDNECKGWYTEIKNELLSYKKVKDRLSWKRESYNLGRIPVARISYRGNTLCLYLPLNPAAYEDSKYKVESVEDNASYQDTPCLYRIKNDKRARYAKELIATVMENLGAVRIERDSVDYFEPYEGLVQLINKGLIKRNIKDKNQEVFFVAKKENKDSENPEEQILNNDVKNEEPDNSEEFPLGEEAKN